MMTQFKYAMRHGTMRLTMLLVVLAVNLGFLLAWQMGARHLAVQIVGMALSGLALTGQLVVQLIADIRIGKDLFHGPSAYLTMLSPVPGRIKLGGRLLAILVGDIGGLTVAISGVVTQAFLLSGIQSLFTRIRPYVAVTAVQIILSYLLFILILFFAETLRTSVFHRFRGSMPLGYGSAFAAAYLLHFLNAVLIPFGSMQRYGLFVHITLHPSLYIGTALYMLTTLAQCALFFWLIANAIDRKVNV